MKPTKLALFLCYMLLLATACYLRPTAGDFDRYVYEAIVRSAWQPINVVYGIVKHESLRAESSSVMDSPGHLAQLEPLYAIRPMYTELVSLVSRAGLAPEKAINLVSAGCLFLLGLFLLKATGSYIYAALLMATPSIVVLGRLGGPDAFSSLIVVAGCVGVLRSRLFAGILLLMVSLWIRTDNVLIVLAVLAWLVWRRHLNGVSAALLAVLAVGSVEWINFWSGNYGWAVLLHYSFVGGRYPAEITSGIDLTQYLHTFVLSGESLAPQLAPWALLGVAAWKLAPESRFLVPIATASALHFLLFPSGEARYFAWACVMCGILFVCALTTRTGVARFSMTPAESRAAA